MNLTTKILSGMCALIALVSCSDTVHLDFPGESGSDMMYDDLRVEDDLDVGSFEQDIRNHDLSFDEGLTPDIAYEDMLYFDMGLPPIVLDNCKCHNAAEVCVLFPDGQLRCQIKNARCVVNEDCEQGYYCGQNGVCECDSSTNSNLCSSMCEDNGDCPDSMTCYRLTNSCVPVGGCIDDVDCKLGSFCIESDEPYRFDYTCEPLGIGARQIGEPCYRDSQCESATCGWGQCISRCLSDADCPSGVPCNGSLDRSVCSPLSTCQQTCTDPKAFCLDNCLPPLCRHTGDCEEGDCIAFGAGRVSMGRCATGPEGINLCKPNEWREGAEDPYCRTTRCALDVECTGAERCLPTRLGTGEPFCARQVRPVP
jgi:hypothetical protein